MALFQVDGRGPTVPGAGTSHGTAASHGAAAVDEHLGALLGEHILPVRQRRSTEDPYLLGVDVLGCPVVVEVVGLLDGPTLLRALAQLGRATRFSLRDIAARYHGGSDRFLPDLATFRESVPATRLAAASCGPRLLVVCTQVADGIGDAVAALHGRGVDILRATRVAGPDGPLLDVSPVHLAVPDGTWSVSHGVAALTAAGGDVTAAWRAAEDEVEDAPGTPMRSTATGLPDTLSRSRAWRRVLDDDALERRPATGPVLDRGAAGHRPGEDAREDRRTGFDRRLEPRAGAERRRGLDHQGLHHPGLHHAAGERPGVGGGRVDSRGVDGATLAGLEPRADQRAPLAARSGADSRGGQDGHASLATPPGPAVHPVPHPAGDPRLAALAAYGPVQLVWTRARRGQRFEARVLREGLIELADGTRVADPGRAAELVSGTPGVDGWRVWRVGVDGPSLGEAVR